VRDVKACTGAFCSASPPGCWGRATATAGSLLAISLLGQESLAISSQLLTQDAVTRALASEAAEAPRHPRPPVQPAATTGLGPAQDRALREPRTATDVPATCQGADIPSLRPPSGDGTVLTSAGGEVVASCQAAGAYLISWSPLQGYEADD